MKQLIQPRYLAWSLPAGLVLGASCMPYIAAQSADPAVARTRMAGLIPLCILLFQIILAWRDGPGSFRFRTAAARWKNLAALLAVAALAGLGAAVFVDPALRRALPRFSPDSLQALLIQLPWTAGFQVLVLVAGVYAFGLRLTRRAEFATAGVVLVHQLSIWARFRSDFTFFPLAALMVFGGALAFLLAEAYRRHGFPGAVAVSLVLSLRHVFPLLTPPV